MSLLASPLLIVNLGCEMLFVLHQRLHAQNVAPIKRRRVLHDIVDRFLDGALLKDLFTPRKLYTFDAAKTLFQTLVHVSIMKLNDTSMSKLFDLMVMICKYHLLHCTDESRLLRVTNTHLEEVEQLIDVDDRKKIANLKTRLQLNFGNLSEDQWRAVWSTLLGFYQGRKIKVSVLMQFGIQHPDGRIVIPEWPKGVEERVGCGNNHDRGSIVVSDDKMVVLEEEAVRSCLPPMPELGTNLYLRREKEEAGVDASRLVPSSSTDMNRKTREIRFLSTLMSLDSRSKAEDPDFDLVLEDNEIAAISVANQSNIAYVHELAKVTDGLDDEKTDFDGSLREFEDELLGHLNDI